MFFKFKRQSDDNLFNQNYFGSYLNQMIRSTNKSSSRYNNLKVGHESEEDKFDSLFSNLKIAQKKRNLVNLVSQRPGFNKKYSNLKAFHSIPLLNNIKRHLSIDVVRETKNNKYQLIVKKSPEKHLSEHHKPSSKSPFYNPKLFEDKVQSKLLQPFHRTINKSTTKDLLNWQELKTFRDLFHMKDCEREIYTSYTNRRFSNGFQNSRKKQIHTQEAQRKTFHPQPSAVKNMKMSPFIIQGNSMNASNSPVWVLNNDN